MLGVQKGNDLMNPDRAIPTRPRQHDTVRIELNIPPDYLNYYQNSTFLEKVGVILGPHFVRRQRK